MLENMWKKCCELILRPWTRNLPGKHVSLPSNAVTARYIINELCFFCFCEEIIRFDAGKAEVCVIKHEGMPHTAQCESVGLPYGRASVRS
jgi:hypothetical protein